MESLLSQLHPVPSQSHGKLSLLPPPKPDLWFKYPAPSKDAYAKSLPFVPNLAPLTSDEPKLVGEWRVGQVVGKGVSGKVRLGRNVRSGDFAAVKMVKKKDRSSKNPVSTDREIIIMKLVEHPNIIKLLDVYETPSHLYLVSSYCPLGELYFHILNHRLGPEIIHRFFSQLVSALTHLHLLGIVHRDVKFENLLLYNDEDGKLGVKLADLGMSNFQKEGSLLETSCGSPHYCSPEVVVGAPYDGPPVDVWSAGVVLYAMIARELPFDDPHIPTLLGRIKKGEYRMSERIGKKAKQLIEGMLEVDVKLRMTIQQVAAHSYLDPMPANSPPSPPVKLTQSLPESNLPYPISIGEGCEMPLEAELDSQIVGNLRILLKEENEEKIREMLKQVPGQLTQIQLFYAILHNFRTRDLIIPSIPTPSSTPPRTKRHSTPVSAQAPHPRATTKSLPPPTPPPRSPLPPTPTSVDQTTERRRRQGRPFSGLPLVAVQPEMVPFPSVTFDERQSTPEKGILSPRETMRRLPISKKLKTFFGTSPASSPESSRASSPEKERRKFKRSSGFYSLKKVVGFNPPLPDSSPRTQTSSSSGWGSGSGSEWSPRTRRSSRWGDENSPLHAYSDKPSTPSSPMQTPSPSPSPPKKRPSPLTLITSNIATSPNVYIHRVSEEVHSSSPAVSTPGSGISSYARLSPRPILTPSTADPFDLLGDLDRSGSSSGGGSGSGFRSPSGSLSPLPTPLHGSTSPSRKPSLSPSLRTPARSPVGSISSVSSSRNSSAFAILKAENQHLKETILEKEDEIERLRATKKRLTEWVRTKEEVCQGLLEEKEELEGTIMRLERELEGEKWLRNEWDGLRRCSEDGQKE